MFRHMIWLPISILLLVFQYFSNIQWNSQTTELLQSFQFAATINKKTRENYIKTEVNSLPPRGFGFDFNCYFQTHDIVSWAFAVLISICKWWRTQLMISQHWFWWWLGAFKQQAITGTTVDQVLWSPIVSLGQNELTTKQLTESHTQSIMWNRNTKSFKIIYYVHHRVTPMYR